MKTQNKFLGLFSSLLFLIVAVANELELRSCEQLTAVPLCTPLEYRQTYYPNHRGHQTQEEANSELTDFVPLLESQCSPYLLHFLCAYYAPLCETFLPPDYTVPPCRELCIHVYHQCQPLLISEGAEWPTHLHCNLFPSKKEMNWCFGPDDLSILNPLQSDTLLSTSWMMSQATANITQAHVPVSTCKTAVSHITSINTQDVMLTSETAQPLDSTSSPSKSLQSHSQSTQTPYRHPNSQPHPHSIQTHSQTPTPIPTPPIASACQSLPATSLCHGLGYTNITFPNTRGHLSLEDAEFELSHFTLLVYIKCSPKILNLLCHYYLPECIDQEPYALLPCRELCQEVQNDCKGKLNHLEIEWPRHIDCKRMPSSVSQKCSQARERNVTVSPSNVRGGGGGSSYNSIHSFYAATTFGLLVWFYSH